MRFLLLGRHRETGEVRLVSELTYPTRQDALDHLPGAMGADDALAGHDLFVVDLDVAVPVVFFQAPAPVADAASEPVADVWETPAAPTDALAEISAVEDAALEGAPEEWTVPETEPSPEPEEAPELEQAPAVQEEPEPELEPAPEPEPAPAVEEAAVVEADDAAAGTSADVESLAEAEPLAAFLEAAADEAATGEPVETPSMEDEFPSTAEAAPAEMASSAEPEEEPGAGDSLAEALRRAASHLESQGIVEPPSVEEFAAPAGDAAWEPPASDVTDVSAAEESAAAEPDEAPTAWPWESAVVEDVVIEALPASEADEELDAILDEIADVPAAPNAAVEPGGAREPASVEPPAAQSESADAPAAFEPVGIDAPGLEDISLLTPVEADAFELRPVIIGEYAETSVVVEESPFAALESIIQESADGTAGAEEPVVADDVPAPDAPPAEEPKPYEPGESDISAYTCADCVYVVTCPKANQDGPATCGSFQWTSV